MFQLLFFLVLVEMNFSFYLSNEKTFVLNDEQLQHAYKPLVPRIGFLDSSNIPLKNEVLEDKTLLEQQLHILSLQGNNITTTVARNVSRIIYRSGGDHWLAMLTSLFYCNVPDHGIVIDRPWLKPCGWQCERLYEAVDELCCLGSDLPQNAHWVIDRGTDYIKSSSSSSSCRYRCQDEYIHRSGSCCLPKPVHASWTGIDGCARQCDEGYTPCLGACCINKATQLRQDWSPLPLIPPPLDYFTANDLDSLLLRNGSSPLSECSLNALDIEKGQLHALYGHPFTCTIANKETLFLRHRSTITPPVTIYHNLIQELRARGANTLLLVGDSISGQHMTDSVCLAEFGGYNYTLSRGNGTELVLEIFHPLSHKEYAAAEEGMNVNITAASDGLTQKASPSSIQKTDSYPYFMMVLISYRDNDDIGQNSIKSFNSTYGEKIKGHPLVVANYGLHFKGFRSEEGEYRRRLKRFLHSLDSSFIFLNRTIIYRETSAQHFSQMHTGEYVDDAHHSDRKCAPLNFTEESYHRYDWKNVALRNILQNSNSTTAFRLNHSVEIVPFFNITAALYDLHSRDGTGGDCTHYCHASLRLIFAGVWSSILDIVRRM